MNERELAREIQDALRRAPRGVLYVEGQTDVPILFALLGVAPPSDGIWQDVLVKGLSGAMGGGGSGGRAVEQRVIFAARRRYGSIWGVVDGDGEPLAGLSGQFDPPHPGPLFRWKAYCIENLLVKTGWPPSWGAPPDWRDILTRYAPYVALNRLGRRVRAALEVLGLHRFHAPVAHEPLVTAADILAALRRDRRHLDEIDVPAAFDAEVASLQATIARDVDEAHALVNGKWLIDAFAVTATGASKDECRAAWCDHARAGGGLAEVRDLWRRLTGREP